MKKIIPILSFLQRLQKMLNSKKCLKRVFVVIYCLLYILLYESILKWKKTNLIPNWLSYLLENIYAKRLV